LKSHEYQLSDVALRQWAGGILVPVVVLAVLLRAGALMGLLPAPRPALDVERTVLTHQAAIAQAPNPADVLFIGDSSCLMDLRARLLEASYGGKHRSQNLGTFMYLGMEGYATLLRNYAASNPGRVKTVVILVHPQMLRGAQPSAEYLGFLSDFYSKADHPLDTSIKGQVSAVLGLHIFEGRVLGRLPVPLAGEFGRYYGFNRNLWDHLDQQRGSAIDPHSYKPAPGEGTADYRLALSLEPGCRDLAAAIPPGARLAIGLAPVPRSFAPPGYPARWQRLLAGWAEWMRPDALLTTLPAVMADDRFASPTHLNEKGAIEYTDQLLRALELRP